MKLILVGLITAVGTFCAERVLANSSPSGIANAQSLQCNEISKADLAGVRDAPISVLAASSLAPTDSMPATCEVTGYIASSVGFSLALPETGWNGKLIQVGCGGFCGAISRASCAMPRRRGYACIATDNGHNSPSRDALWAYNNLLAEVDHGFRATHVSALAGRAIVAHFYGRAPTKVYFMGGSTGGRQALIAAQRFPWDFDGIIAGVPSISVSGIHATLLWANRAFNGEDGAPLFKSADLEILHRAILERCDLNDGVKDGLIGDPRTCAFQVADIQCATTRPLNCLTPRQVAAAERIYGGPVTSSGESIYIPAVMKGSERAWLDWFDTKFSTQERGTYHFVREEFRYAAFDPDPGPAWQPENFDFDRDPKRLGVSETLSSADNPDLRRFRGAGGKLIAYAGWADAAGMPLHAVDYYEMVERLMGSREVTQQFFRLFVVPGMGHATEADVIAVDWLTYLETWVERNHPPEQVIAYRMKAANLTSATAKGTFELMRELEFPLSASNVELSRPIYPYPLMARYRGKGDPNTAASFRPE